MIFKLIFGLLFLSLNTSVTLSLSTMSDEVLLSVSTTEILDGLSTDLEVRCSFTGRANPSLASVLSIQISHSVTTDRPLFYFIASVNAIEGHAHNITHEVSEISGAINNGPPFLSVRMEDPSSQNAGVYKCDISGFDQEGKPVELTNVTMVTTSRYDMDTLRDEVNKMVSTVQDQETFLHTLLRRLDNMKESMFYGPVSYSGHQYYIVKKRTYFMRSEAQAVCKFVGGYLAELDSHGEYVFLRDWILRVSTNETAIYTGATDENQEGVWVNEHSSTASPSFDWGTNRPTLSALHNCQCYYYDSSLYLTDCLCSYRNGITMYVGYICEVP